MDTHRHESGMRPRKLVAQTASLSVSVRMLARCANSRSAGLALIITHNSILIFFNPKGIAPHSPGLPSLRGYPGSQAETFTTLKGLRLLAASDVVSYLHARTKTQPRWGCDRNPRPPRVVALLQPWALRRNPFGIQEFPHPGMWNDKAFRLDAMKSFAIGWASDYWLFAAGQFKCRCRNWYVPLPLIVCGPLKNSMSVRSSIPSLA